MKASFALLALALALTSAGCASMGGQIEVLGLPRQTENGTTSNRVRIYERKPTPPVAPAPLPGTYTAQN